MNYKGNIKLYIGPMFSGKTTTLLEDYDKYKIAGKKCILIKHLFDVRYGENHIITHNKRENTESITCRYLYEIDNIVYKFDAVFIDEIQFFEDAPVFCEKWATDGMHVIVAGLSGTFERKEFPVITQLIPLAEEIVKKYAICKETGKKANFSFRTSDSKNTIDIGGLDKYKAVDRQTYIKSLSDKEYIIYQLKLIEHFINIYNKVNHTNIKFNSKQLRSYIKSYNKLNYNDIISYLSKNS